MLFCILFFPISDERKAILSLQLQEAYQAVFGWLAMICLPLVNLKEENLLLSCINHEKLHGYYSLIQTKGSRRVKAISEA